jgi:hypothetical protein
MSAPSAALLFDRQRLMLALLLQLLQLHHLSKRRHRIDRRCRPNLQGDLPRQSARQAAFPFFPYWLR